MGQVFEIKGRSCTTKEAAARLAVTPRTIQLWSDSGVISAWKTPGGHRRFNIQDIEALQARLLGADIEPRRRLKMLVIEDEPDLLSLYRFNIESWGLPIELKTAKDGYEGLLKIGSWQPDLIISDLQMPNMDGFHMLNMLSKQNYIDKAAIIVITALSVEDIKEHGTLPEGLTIYTKPIPFSKIEDQVRLCLDVIADEED